jgi:glycosyltransferase involved in cell wall biosynthesis
MRLTHMNTPPSSPPHPIALVCFSHLRWGFVFQRPQHLLTRAARNYEVYFVEEPIFEDVATWSLRRDCPSPHVTVITPVLPRHLAQAPHEAILRKAVDKLMRGLQQHTVIGWYYTPMALLFTDHLAFDVTVYDCMDQLSAFHGAPPEMSEMEQAMFSRADVVFTGGMSLYEDKRDAHHNVHAFPSSIDLPHFKKALALRGKDAEDQENVPHPRIGFFGVIDERTNLDLIAEVAEMRPQWQWVIIGPVVKIDPATLPRRANIHWLGSKSYQDLPHYLAGWDAGFMPFALNDATRFISPTKTPEFLAAGLPVVSTSIRDVIRPYGEAGLVEITDTASEMVESLDLLLTRPRELWLKRVERQLSKSSWDSVWNDMRVLIENELPDAATPEADADKEYGTHV